jgi:hypothetical protein
MSSLVLKMSVSLDGYVAPPDRSTGWEAAGRSPRRRELDPRDREQRRGAPHGCHHLHQVGRLLAQRPGAVRKADERHPQSRVLGLHAVRARSLVQSGLIDEYRLVVHPVVLDAGERLFTAPLTIEPISTTAFSGGAVAHVFAAHP